MVSFYPALALNPFFVIRVKFQGVLSTLLFNVYGPLMDIVPAMIFYHAATILEGTKWEVRELNNNNQNASSTGSKSGIIHSLWSRFEALAVMVDRADKLFGTIVIMCHAYLFCNMCGNVFLLLRDVSLSNAGLHHPNRFFYLLFPSFRFIFTLYLMSKLSYSSSELVSAVANFSNQRATFSDEEERRMVTPSFLNRLKQTELAPCPSGYYHIKQSIFMTALNLIVTCTIILLQTNNGAPSNSTVTMQNSTCACTCHC